MPEVRLIDANALMKKICGNECGSIFDEECENVMCNFYDYIMKEPTIEAKPVRHGRWVSEKVRKRNWKGVEHDYFQPNSCSVCHTGFAVRTNFCPNCGARMDVPVHADKEEIMAWLSEQERGADK